MSDENVLINLITQLAISLPIILVCVISLAIVTMRPIAKKTKRAAMIGLSLLTVDAIAGTFRMYVHSQAYLGGDYGSDMFRWVQQGYGVVTSLLYIAGIIFLVIAICVKESQATKNPVEQNPYAE
jgi:protein-S-isoprenylcysteine O-methyltransferase Ste14